MFEFLSFARKAPDNPLATLRSVTLWMNELLLSDLYVAHDKVVRALVEFNDRKEPLTKERLQIFMHIDESAREMQQSLCRQYLLNPRMSKVIESRLWNAIYAFYWEVTRGYHAFIMDFVANPKNTKIKSLVPLVTARALSNFGSLFKWRYFRYEKIEERLWKRLHNLFHFAEFAEIEHDRLALYSTEKRQTSCVEAYLHVLMLATMNSGGFYPKQIEVVDGWLINWLYLIKLEKQFNPDKHVFYVNLQRGIGARRVRKIEPDEMRRYWNTDTLTNHLTQIKTALQNGKAPAQLGLSEDCKLPGCFDLLEYLMRQWAPQIDRSQRKYVRNRVMKMIEVAHSFPEICAQVRRDNDATTKQKSINTTKARLSYDEMIDVRLYGFITERTQEKASTKQVTAAHDPAGIHERWVMENESTQGYGGTIDNVAGDWVRLDKLVSLKPDRGSPWRIGTVCRLTKLSPNQIYVGIELLPEAPVVVMLRPQQADHDSGYTVDGRDAMNLILPLSAIYLPNLTKNGQGSIILETIEYALGRVFELSAGRKTYMIRLRDVIAKGDGWLRAGFEVISGNTRA